MKGEHRVGPVLCILLVALAALREGGGLDARVGGLLTLGLLATGVIWALRGRGKLERLAELYLWLSFILSLDLLKVLSDALARGFGVGELAVFRPVAVAHVLLCLAALWVLGAWRRSGRLGSHPFALRLAAGLLVAGAVIFWVGARTFPGSALPAVAANLEGHLWTSVAFALATLVTLPGLGLLTLRLHESGDRAWSPLALSTFAFGAVFWLLHLAFRATAVRAAAGELSRTGSAPPWYPPLAEGSGLLFGLFSLLAYLAIAAWGTAILRTALLPRWLGWTCVVAGILAAPLFGPPLFIHVVFWIVGMAILGPAAREHTDQSP